MSRGPSSAAQRLLVAEALPCEWEPGDQTASEALSVQAESNLRVLQAAELFDERSRPAVSDNAAENAELARIHAKLDVLMLLVCQALSRQRPAASPLLLMHDGFFAPQRVLGLPEVGQRAWCRLWLHSGLPLPWRWPMACVADRPDGAELHFLELPDVLQAAWDRHVFRRHRRELALRHRSSES